MSLLSNSEAIILEALEPSHSLIAYESHLHSKGKMLYESRLELEWNDIGFSDPGMEALCEAIGDHS